jgi:regulator of ribonuclease activity A
MLNTNPAPSDAATMNSTHSNPPATTDLCDAHKAAEPEGWFRVLPQVFKSFGAKAAFFGPVVTVKCFEDNSRVKELVESAGDLAQGGRVLVVDGGGSLRQALLGGNLGAAAARNGWAGVVVDGCVRDVNELSACQVGIYALASVPMPTVRKGQGEVGVPVRLRGVWVRPGDWLYADADGIVITDRAL